MISITDGESCGMEGDYLAWSDMKINTAGVLYKGAPTTVAKSNITLRDLCQKGSYTEVRARGYLKFGYANKLCKKMGKSHIYTPISIEHETNNSIRSYKRFWATWVGIDDIEEEGVWRRKDNGAITNYTNWANGQPNGDKDSNDDSVMAQGGKGWDDVVTDCYNAITVCVNYEQPLYRLRGLCPETNFPVIFAPFNYGVDSDNLVYHSFFRTKTVITFDKTSKSWLMIKMSANGNYTNATAIGGMC